MAAATTSVNGYLTSTDWTTFNGKQAALVSGTNIKTVNGTTLLGSGDLGTITYAYGGTGLTSYTAGDIIYASAANTVAKLAIGTSGQRLVVAAGLPSWATDTTTGTVTSVAASVPAFLSVAGSPITTSGTLAITLSGTALPVLNGGTGVTTSTGTGDTVLSASPTLSGDVTLSTGNLVIGTSGKGIALSDFGGVRSFGWGNVSSIAQDLATLFDNVSFTNRGLSIQVQVITQRSSSSATSATFVGLRTPDSTWAFTLVNAASAGVNTITPSGSGTTLTLTFSLANQFGVALVTLISQS